MKSYWKSKVEETERIYDQAMLSNRRSAAKTTMEYLGKTLFLFFSDSFSCLLNLETIKCLNFKYSPF